MLVVQLRNAAKFCCFFSWHKCQNPHDAYWHWSNIMLHFSLLKYWMLLGFELSRKMEMFRLKMGHIKVCNILFQWMRRFLLRWVIHNSLRSFLSSSMLFMVNVEKIMQGNRRTPDKFVGKEAVITSVCLNGWLVA